jgi:hypothetical protein
LGLKKKLIPSDLLLKEVLALFNISFMVKSSNILEKFKIILREQKLLYRNPKSLRVEKYEKEINRYSRA